MVAAIPLVIERQVLSQASGKEYFSVLIAEFFRSQRMLEILLSGLLIVWSLPQLPMSKDLFLQ